MLSRFAYRDWSVGCCSCCDAGALGDERHLVFEYTALAPLQQTYADLFTGDTDNMRAFFAHQDYMRVIYFIVDCLDFMGK